MLPYALVNKLVFVKHSYMCYFLVIAIFYCAITTAFHMHAWKFLEKGC